MLCKTFACELPERDCLARQEMRRRAGGKDRRPVQFRACDPERCAQGAELRAKLEREGQLAVLLEDLARSRA